MSRKKISKQAVGIYLCSAALTISLLIVAAIYKPAINVALVEAVDLNDAQQMTNLIALGADAKWKDSDGNTLLVQHSSSLTPQCATILILHGVQVNDHIPGGATALMVAASANNVNLVHFLISKGANINEQTPNGSSALMLAAPRSTETANILLQNGADPYLHNVKGETALSIAKSYNNQHAARLLEHTTSSVKVN